MAPRYGFHAVFFRGFAPVRSVHLEINTNNCVEKLLAAARACDHHDVFTLRFTNEKLIEFMSTGEHFIEYFVKPYCIDHPYSASKPINIIMYSEDEYNAYIQAVNEQGQTGTKEKECILICDRCNKPITGHRFRCVICPKFELCQDCEAEGAHAEHGMIRMVYKGRLEVDIPQDTKVDDDEVFKKPEPIKRRTNEMEKIAENGDEAIETSEAGCTAVINPPKDADILAITLNCEKEIKDAFFVKRIFENSDQQQFMHSISQFHDIFLDGMDSYKINMSIPQTAVKPKLATLDDIKNALDIKHEQQLQINKELYEGFEMIILNNYTMMVNALSQPKVDKDILELVKLYIKDAKNFCLQSTQFAKMFEQKKDYSRKRLSEVCTTYLAEKNENISVNISKSH
ncbi:unnamed protein product [Caenorhabditis bovis]|uniref:ZZ-type domain-containing protein n=1 Tax=Caenorhabditis bovis TaxID=2654633 RepID=A0A8S1FA87_9PELO|nr:unnamed protein product [Caenorhabditis bovis]